MPAEDGIPHAWTAEVAVADTLERVPLVVYERDEAGQWLEKERHDFVPNGEAWILKRIDASNPDTVDGADVEVQRLRPNGQHPSPIWSTTLLTESTGTSSVSDGELVLMPGDSLWWKSSIATGQVLWIHGRRVRLAL